MNNIEVLINRFNKHNPIIINNSNLINSAIIIPLIFVKNKLEIIFIKRSDKVKHHKNQIAFPGGKFDKDDKNLLKTALREIEEEIGITENNIKILGRLDDTTTFVTNYIISPFIGLILNSGIQLKPNIDEISEIIKIPIDELLKKENFLTEEIEHNCRKYIIYKYIYKDHIIWGATSRILKQFLELYKKINHRN